MNQKAISKRMFIACVCSLIAAIIFITVERHTNTHYIVSHSLLTCSLVMFYMGLSFYPEKDD